MTSAYGKNPGNNVPSTGAAGVTSASTVGNANNTKAAPSTDLGNAAENQSCSTDSAGAAGNATPSTAYSNDPGTYASSYLARFCLVK